MYLFIFSVLLILFQFVNSKNILESYEKKIDSLLEKEIVLKDSITALGDQNFELMRFSLEFNYDAKTYLEDKGYDVDQLIPFIKDELYKLNIYEGDDHPIVPYVSMTDNKMMIDNIKLLNHKWIIANFSDGKYWGEMLIKYEIIDKENLKFDVLEYTLYRPQ